MSSSYRSNRLGLSHWDPYTMCRGGCLELYYCNMVEWFWWDSSLILIIIIIMPHLYSAMGSAIGIQRRWWRQLRLCEQVGFEFAFESLKSLTGSNVSRQRVPCLWWLTGLIVPKWPIMCWVGRKATNQPSVCCTDWHLKCILQWTKQKAPLTLRGQRGCCRNVKGEPQIYGSFPNPRSRPLVLWVLFYGGPWQT